MIRNFSYNNQQIKAETDREVGIAFGWFQRIKMGGIGSKRMQILESSQALWELLSYQRSTKYCYIELRPKGIIIHFRSILETIGWVIPFRHLNFKLAGKKYLIRDGENFISIGGVNQAPPDHPFFQKLQQLMEDQKGN